MTLAQEEDAIPGDVGRSLEAAAVAVSRLDALAAVSPARQAWLRRSTFMAAVRALEADGYIFELERLFALAANLPVPRARDYGLDRTALEVLAGVMTVTSAAEGETSAIDGSGDLGMAVGTVRRAAERGPVLAGALRGLRDWVAADGRPSLGLVALALVVAERGVIRDPAPWLAGAISARAILADGLSPIRWIRRALQEVVHAAAARTRALADLEATQADWRRRLGSRRSTSRLDLVVELALAYPILSPVQVSALLGLSVRGAAKLLDELVALRILLPPRREGTWRFFIAADLRDIKSHLLEEGRAAPLAKEAVGTPLPPSRPGLPAATRAPKPIREPDGFRDLLAATDNVVRRVTDHLARYDRKIVDDDPHE